MSHQPECCSRNPRDAGIRQPNLTEPRQDADPQTRTTNPSQSSHLPGPGNLIKPPDELPLQQTAAAVGIIRLAPEIPEKGDRRVAPAHHATMNRSVPDHTPMPPTLGIPHLLLHTDSTCHRRNTEAVRQPQRCAIVLGRGREREVNRPPVVGLLSESQARKRSVFPASGPENAARSLHPSIIWPHGPQGAWLENNSMPTHISSPQRLPGRRMTKRSARCPVQVR